MSGRTIKKYIFAIVLIICFMSLMLNMLLIKLDPPKHPMDVLDDEHEVLVKEIKGKAFDYLASNGYINIPSKLSGEDVVVRVGDFNSNGSGQVVNLASIKNMSDVRNLTLACNEARFDVQVIEYPDVQALVNFQFKEGAIVGHDVWWIEGEGLDAARREISDRQEAQRREEERKKSAQSIIKILLKDAISVLYCSMEQTDDRLVIVVEDVWFCKKGIKLKYGVGDEIPVDGYRFDSDEKARSCGIGIITDKQTMPSFWSIQDGVFDLPPAEVKKLIKQYLSKKYKKP